MKVPNRHHRAEGDDSWAERDSREGSAEDETEQNTTAGLRDDTAERAQQKTRRSGTKDRST